MITYGSVCSGIEAASVAWEPIGMKPAWFSQFDPDHNYKTGPDFPSDVLAHHWPHIPNLGDMTKLPSIILSRKIPAPDVLVGGTPCQAYSVAGMRNGLADSRGMLTIKFMELANDIDTVRYACGLPPTIITWENVPGVLSSKDNAFGCFLAGLAGENCELQSAGGKWSNAGCVFGPKRTIAWRVLDAQYFGLAQRRKRVFVIASAREGFSPPAVLFEQEGLRRDSAPERYEKDGAWDSSIIENGSHWDDPRNPHPTLNQCFNTGGIGASNQEIFSQRGAGLIPVKLNGLVVARKMTPVEYERLQGFPDDYTKLSDNTPNGVRYKAIGNSMAVPVMRWIGQRILNQLI